MTTSERKDQLIRLYNRFDGGCRILAHSDDMISEEELEALREQIAILAAETKDAGLNEQAT